MTAAVVQKIEDRIFDDVIASFRDPASATVAEKLWHASKLGMRI